MSIRPRISVILCLLGREVRQNALVYLLPLPALLALLVHLLVAGEAYALGTRASVAVLVAGAVFAIVYGQQGFATESDRKTLDFLLSRPVPPALLTLVKYLTNVGVYAVWLGLFASCLRFNLTGIPMAAGAAAGWAVFGLMTLAGMSFLAGLLTRGAERLLTTVLFAGASAGLCYLLWNRVLSLAAAR